jgi:hypothetical protein
MAFARRATGLRQPRFRRSWLLWRRLRQCRQRLRRSWQSCHRSRRGRERLLWWSGRGFSWRTRIKRCSLRLAGSAPQTPSTGTDADARRNGHPLAKPSTGNHDELGPRELVLPTGQVSERSPRSSLSLPTGPARCRTGGGRNALRKGSRNGSQPIGLDGGNLNTPLLTPVGRGSLTPPKPPTEGLPC